MLLDKLQFLEKAVETSVLEILEEVDVIKEGSDPKVSADFIASIAKDLLETFKNFEYFPIEEHEVKQEEPIEETIDTSSTTAYDIGETIILHDANSYIPAASLYRAFGVKPSSLYCRSSSIKVGEEAIILDKQNDPYSKTGEVCYLVEQDGKRFFVRIDHFSPL